MVTENQFTQDVRNISLNLHCVEYLLCVSKKAEYKSRVSNGSGRSLKYSLNNAATSCGLSSTVNFVFSPESN